jgi:phosphinothricin acetyltransferase
MTQPPLIRLATAADLPAIDDIYNHYVLCSTCTYQTEPTTPAERDAWFGDRAPQYPVTVAELNGEVIGWASLSRFRERSAYDRTVENAVYVSPTHQRRGVGSTLLADSVERAIAAGHHAIIAAIDAEQPGSIALHERHGFTRAAYLREVGFKFGRWLDVVYMQRLLGA